MNIFLWVVQGTLACLLLAGGATKAFKYEELAKMPAMGALPRGGWRTLGFIEMLCAVLLVVPMAIAWRPELTAYAGSIILLESLALSTLYARFSRKLAASNPLVWSGMMAVLASVVAYGRGVGLAVG